MADTPDVQLLGHTVFAVAVAILTPKVIPAQESEARRADRLRVKRRCMAFARHHGFNLQLIQMSQGEETWVLESMDLSKVYAKGTLQHCCRYLVDNECVFPALDK